jgi:hypothetical protein
MEQLVQQDLLVQQVQQVLRVHQISQWFLWVLTNEKKLEQ